MASSCLHTVTAGSPEIKLWFLLGRGGVVWWYGLEVLGYICHTDTSCQTRRYNPSVHIIALGKGRKECCRFPFLLGGFDVLLSRVGPPPAWRQPGLQDNFTLAQRSLSAKLCTARGSSKILQKCFRTPSRALSQGRNFCFSVEKVCWLCSFVLLKLHTHCFGSLCCMARPSD